MTRDDRNDGQVLGEHELYVTKDRMAALWICLARLCGDELVNTRFPFRGRLGLLRMPLVSRATAA
jgi:hypothetical protein